MKKFSFLFFLSALVVVLSAFIVLADPVINLNLLTSEVVCSTGNDTARYTLSASGIPSNTNIVIYQSTDSTFNPYNNQGDSIAYIPGSSIPRDTVNFGTCVKTLGIFIDACGATGQEGKNEYMILTSGTGIKVSNLAINFDPANSNSGDDNDNDINTGTNPCSFKTPNATLISNLQIGSCNASNIIPASPTDSIPPNAIILCFTSDNVTANYSVNGLCNLGFPIYVIQSSCTRTIGAFTNAASCSSTPTTRYRKTIAIDKRQNCQDNFVYDRCGLFDEDGTYAIRQTGTDTTRVSNNGIRRNAIDSCGGIDYAQLNFSADTTLKFRISTNFCNTGYHYIKAITHPNGSQPVSNTIQYKLVCNDVTATSTTTNICSGDSVKINISSTDPNATFSWTVSGGAGITGASAGTGNSIKQLLTYNGTTKDSITYTAISNDAGCIKTQTIKVVVNKCLVCTPNFTAPDTVCVGQNVVLQNQTNCATANYWNFCSGNLDDNPTGTNLGNIGNQLSSPVFVELVEDNNIKYAFVVNHVTNGGASNGQIVKLKYGNSYLNTPVVTNLGDFGVSNYIIIEGLQIKKDGNGNWYGLTASGGLNFEKIVRLNFGNSLDNVPTATDFGNLGNLNFPGDLYMFKEAGNWYTFISNSRGNSIVRLSFGASLANTPTATDLGNFGVFTSVGEFNVTNENGNWYMFAGNNNDITRLNFGNSLLNNPTLTTYTLPVIPPYGIKTLKDCGHTFGFLTHPNNTITKMEFPNGVSGAPTFTNLGNIASFNFPHSISNIFRDGDSVYMFIPNVNSNSLSRIVFGNCNNSSIPSSTQANPPVYTYNAVGTYNVSLTIDEGTPTQATVCKSIVVVNPVSKPDASINQIICSTDSIRLTVANIDATATYAWTGPNGFSSTNPNVSLDFNNPNQAGQYIVTTTGNCDFKKDTVSFVIPNLSLQISGNGEICNGNTVTLVANGTFDSVRWSNGFLGTQLVVSASGSYTAFGYLNGCNTATTVRVTDCQQQICNPDISGNRVFCDGDSITLDAGSGFTSYTWNTGAITQTIKVKTPGKYVVTVTGQDNCTGKDSVQVNTNPVPQVSISGSTTFCNDSHTDLTANADADSLRWSTNETTATISASQEQSYSVTVYKNGCSASASVQVSLLDPPSAFSLGNDTTFCGDFTRVLSTGNQNTEWSTDESGAQITVTEEGTYIAIISNDCGSVSDTIVISKNDLPIVDLGNDTAFCDGELLLSAPSEMRSYLWSTGDQSTEITVTEEGVYFVRITDGNGCANSDTIVISSNCANDLWIPNAFTPNGDGVNDVFLVRGNPRNTTIEKFVIYNRWGNKVFEANNILPSDVTTGWDGKYKGEPSPFEVYGYEVIARFSNGEKKTLKGNVTLLK